MDLGPSPHEEASKPAGWSAFADGIFSAYSSAFAFDAIVNAAPEWPKASGHHHDDSGTHGDIHGDSAGPPHYDDHNDIHTA